MRTRTYTSRRRRLTLVVVLVGSLTAVLFILSGILIATTDSAHAPNQRPNQAPEPLTSPPSGEPSSAGHDEARAFAIEAAQMVFDWDTTTSSNTDGYFARLVAIADPGGVESDGLVADLTTYLPNPEAWRELRAYETRQWLEVTSAMVPSTWEATAREGEAYGLERGTTAYTITGIRHRAGTWNGEPVTSRHRVSFTVFILCVPREPSCYLLRLSRLDHPLL